MKELIVDGIKTTVPVLVGCCAGYATFEGLCKAKNAMEREHWDRYHHYDNSDMVKDVVEYVGIGGIALTVEYGVIRTLLNAAYQQV